ncbi:glycosyltransferase family 4 protein [Photobacterium sp. BZF1]|uniref:glycosyltransferase family 4 protein n=1 Tax=Photobacterium sp. BZF1 TaxID=1904457 RepID=UPI0016535758|nr:glycosyltransferase family 4 protein [Photobacterium sp. BZF1]MBC7006272.1 glycosyltransferase family 4 protein [Photobacterium sp. BZF1]
MKILYHHRIASKDGQYVHVEEIINALRSLGHEVIVVAPSIAEHAEFGSDGGWVSRLRQALPKFFSELLEFGYSFFVFFKLISAIIKHRPDAIYERYNLFLPAGIWAKKICRLKLLLEVNSPLYDERMKYGGISLGALAKWTEFYTWRNADHICPVTSVLAGYIKKAGVPESRITVIPNGIDPSKFYPVQSSKRHPNFKGKLTIGFVGFCREWHQLDKLLSLISETNQRNLMLLVIGDGPVASELKQQAKQLGIEDNFYITGLVKRSEMPSWLDQIDIALQPAVTPWSSPLKLIEYLAKGKAIIAPDTNNIRELLTHGSNALLYDIENPNSILDKTLTIINDERLRLSLQQEAINTVKDKRLTWDNNATVIESIFTNLAPSLAQPVKQ